jgi:hypothetical protein
MDRTVKKTQESVADEKKERKGDLLLAKAH